MQFGRKSEKLERQIEQLELRLEDPKVKNPSISITGSPAFGPPNCGVMAKPAEDGSTGFCG